MRRSTKIPIPSTQHCAGSIPCIAVRTGRTFSAATPISIASIATKKHGGFAHQRIAATAKRERLCLEKASTTGGMYSIRRMGQFLWIGATPSWLAMRLRTDATAHTAPTLGAEEITAAAPATATSSVIVTRTLRLKVRPESYRWLKAAATEVNHVWNWCNEISAKAARPYVGEGKWLSGFDLCKLSSGATQCFERIGADTIQRVNLEYALRRRQFQKVKLRFRISRGVRRSLGWVPFKAASLKRHGKAVRFCGKTFRLFEAERIEGVRWQQGCFAQDALGDWWLCLPVEYAVERSVAPHEVVGIDLGLKAIATSSDGESLDAGRWTERYADRLCHGTVPWSQAPGEAHASKDCEMQSGCLAQVFTKDHRSLSDDRRGRCEQHSVGEDADGEGRARLWLGDAQADAAVQRRARRRSVQIVQERFTTRACSSCGCLTGPSGPRALVVRRWCCAVCGAAHDRDVNAARNILARSRCRTAVCGNESPSLPVQPCCAPRARKARTEPASSAA